MEREGRKYNEVERDKDEIVLFQDLDRDGIIKKYLEYKQSLVKAKEDIDTYRSLLVKLTEQHEALKSKIPDIRHGEYNKAWSWTNKIVFVLKKIDRPLLSSEIINDDLIIPSIFARTELRYCHDIKVMERAVNFQRA
jgi:hypothetical protein